MRSWSYFLNELLGLFSYPPLSGRVALFPFGIVLLVLLAGPPLGLPVPGRVVDLVTAGVGAVQQAVAAGVRQEVLVWDGKEFD